MTSTSRGSGPADDGMATTGNGRFQAQFWKTELCRFWRSGCRNGKLCPFAHGEQEMMGRPDLCKTSLCQRWAKGACPLEASECRFAHGRLDLRATPNFMHGVKGDCENGQGNDEFDVPETEGVLLGSGGDSSGNPHVSQGWEEQDFSDPYMNGGSHHMRWEHRSHGNHGNPGGEALLDQMQAVLAQREWQWSPEYGDGLQDGDTHHSNRRSRGRIRGGPKPPSGPLDAGDAGPIAATGAANNGRPQQMPEQLQMLLNGAQNGPQGLQEPQQNWTPASGSGWSDAMQAPAAATNGRPHPHGGNQLHLLLGINGGQNGTPSFPEPQLQQNWPLNGGWPDGMQEENKRRAAELASYTGRSMDLGYAPKLEVSEFPHAITAPDSNIMHMSVPQELKAIWG